MRVLLVAVSAFVAVACSTTSPPLATEATAAPSSSRTQAVGERSESTATSSTKPTTEATATTTTTTAPPTIDECLAVIPLRVRLGQLLLPVVTQAELVEVAQLASTGALAGAVLVGPVDAGLGAELARVQASSVVGPSLLAVDEEGGRVQRVADLVGRVPSARDLARSNSSADARSLARAHAERLAGLGFTVNLAPVLDLDLGTYIRDRSFASDPDQVVEYGLAVAQGILEAGLLPVAKHFPGHGRGVDSHTGLPELPPLAELQSDLVPFRAAADAGLPIMIGHLVVPDLTAGEPASLSPEAISGLLRTEIGFDGLVMTDALNMDAIAATRSGDEAAELALVAGADLAMLGRLADVEPALDRLLLAVAEERLAVEALNRSFLRVLDAKGVSACDLPADVAPAIRCDGVTDGGCGLVAG